MSKLIKIFLITLFALAISCKSNEEPASEIAGENPPAGEYTGDNSGEKGTVTINADGSCTIDGTISINDNLNARTTITFNITVNSWYKTYNSQSGSYDGFTYTRDFVINSFTGSNSTTGSNYTSSQLNFHWGVNSYSGKTFLHFYITDGIGSSSLTLN